jgi:methyl-accepting chemotaxis protein
MKWELKDQEDEIAPGLFNILNSLRLLLSETKMLINSAVEGELSVRGDVSKFKGGYKEIIEGINQTLDAINTPVEEGREVLSIMATGDLSARVTGEFSGDHEKLKSSINTLGDSLSNLVQQVTEAISATASASAEISSSTEQMSSGAQEQSMQTNEVAGAVEQMTSTIIQTSKNAGNVAESANLMKEKATLGSNKVDNNKKGIQRIIDSSELTGKIINSLAGKTDQIGDIAQVIDDIADQTNLLALNAAIEAARAGEQGRGFAVVADEVRKLAERTTKATKEIAETIKAIQGEAKDANNSMSEARDSVEEGMKLTVETESVFREILEGTQSLSMEINQVAAASEEQSSGAEQISKTIEGISSVTQESAAAIQQVATTAEDLNRMTENLLNLISKFKIDNNYVSKISSNQAILENEKQSLLNG